MSEEQSSECLSGSDEEDLVIEPIAKKARGKGSKKTPHPAPLSTLKSWLKKHAKYSAKDVNKGVEMTWAGKASGLEMEDGVLICKACSVAQDSLVTVAQDTLDHLKQHFGFRKLAPS